MASEAIQGITGGLSHGQLSIDALVVAIGDLRGSLGLGQVDLGGYIEEFLPFSVAGLLEVGHIDLGGEAEALGDAAGEIEVGQSDIGGSASELGMAWGKIEYCKISNVELDIVFFTHRKCPSHRGAWRTGG